MKTEYITDDIEKAARLLRGGGLVAVPTETVYGLAADGTNVRAVERIYEVKGRPAVKPLSLMVEGPQAMERLWDGVPRAARLLAEQFWPGPLTLVYRAAPQVLELVRAGGATVGLRCPDEQHTLSLLRACGVPLAVPSANPSGKPSPKTAQEVAGYFDGAIEAILDGGPCGIGRESTIVDLTAGRVNILRQGALAEKEIDNCLMRGLRIVGVTGGTGTGKTTALDALRDRGALVIDADEVYHKLCAEDAEMLARIGERFPGTVEQGVLQRKKLGAAVFADKDELAALQQITDYYVDRQIDRLLADHAAAGGRLAAVDAIDLVGTPLAAFFCAVIGITAPEELRAERIMAREGIDRDYALLRIRAQRPDSFFEQYCDYTVRNDGSLEKYRAQMDKILDEIERHTPWTN